MYVLSSGNNLISVIQTEYTNSGDIISFITDNTLQPVLNGNLLYFEQGFYINTAFILFETSGLTPGLYYVVIDNGYSRNAEPLFILSTSSDIDLTPVIDRLDNIDVNLITILDKLNNASADLTLIINKLDDVNNSLISITNSINEISDKIDNINIDLSPVINELNNIRNDLTSITNELNSIYQLEYNRLKFLRNIDYDALYPSISSITTYRHDTFDFQFTITDSEGAPVNLTNYDVYISSPLFKYAPNTSGNNIQCEIIDAVNGIVKGSFYAGKEGSYKAQICLIDKTTSHKRTIGEINIYVKEDFYREDADETPPFEDTL